MTSLEDFLNAWAKDFEIGALDRLSNAILTPTSIYIAQELLLIGNRDAAKVFLSTYRDSLVAMGYHHTDILIIEKIKPDADRVRAKVSCMHFDASGVLVSSSRGFYYCSRDNADNWSISLIEFETALEANLTESVPVL